MKNPIRKGYSKEFKIEAERLVLEKSVEVSAKREKPAKLAASQTT